MKKAIIAPLLFVFSIFSVSSQEWEEVNKIVASDRAENDRFGSSVSVYNEYSIISAPNVDSITSSGDTLINCGSAYICKRDFDGNWSEIQQLLASDKMDQDFFGNDVSLYGNYAVIGAPDHGLDASGANYLIGAGAVYIFKMDTIGIWSQVQKIVASDRNEYDSFGNAVSIFEDYMIVGAYREDEDASGNNTLQMAGSAYIYKKDINGNFIEVQKIIASDRDTEDKFGFSVSTSGTYAIVGAPFEDHDSAGGNFMAVSGSAYIFEKNNGGTWTEVKKIVASDRQQINYYGEDVDISGTKVIVGAYAASIDYSPGSFFYQAGKAYIYERNSNNSWSETQIISASDPSDFDYFGGAVSISGNVVVVGAHCDDENIYGSDTIQWAGSAYIFDQDSSGFWIQRQKVTATDRNQAMHFGFSVSIHNNYTIIGAFVDDFNVIGSDSVYNAGSTYFFEICHPTSSLIETTECDSYTVPSGDETYYLSGLYMDTIPNIAGCDSIITIDLTIIMVDTSVTVNSPMLTANATDAMYQWINCETMSAMIGDTNQSFIATSNGNYAVIVSQLGCADTSSCYQIIDISTVENGIKKRIILYPNPASAEMIIELLGKVHPTTISILDMHGAKLDEYILTKGNSQLKIDVSDYNPGVYLAVITDDNIVISLSKFIVK